MQCSGVRKATNHRKFIDLINSERKAGGRKCQEKGWGKGCLKLIKTPPPQEIFFGRWLLKNWVIKVGNMQSTVRIMEPLHGNGRFM